MDMAVTAYAIADRLPKSETFGLRMQMSRAAALVPANIAEGSARGTRKDYANFLSIAKGSIVEMETYLSLAVRPGCLTVNDVRSSLNLSDEVGKMLTAIRSKLLAAVKRE